MATSGAVRAGRAYVELFGKDTKLNKMLKRASLRLKAFGKSVTMMGARLTALGVAAALPLAASIKSFASQGDKLDKMSARTGVAVEILSEMAYVTEIAGSNIEMYEKAILAMSKALRGASQGLLTQKQALADIGLEYKDLEGLDPHSQFLLIMEALKRVTNESQRAAISQELFSRAGKQLIPVMKLGAKGIEKLRKEAHAFGLTMSTEEAAAAAKFTDAMTLLWHISKRLLFVIGSALAPALEQLVKWMASILKPTLDWLKANKTLVLSVAKIVGAFIGLSITISALGFIFSGVGTIIGLLWTALSILGSVFMFLLSPIGLVIAAMGVLAAWFITSTKAGAEAAQWLGDQFIKLKDDAVTMTGGIVDALKAGDIKLAAKILWLGLKVAWIRGINVLEKAWLGFRKFFLLTSADMFHGLITISIEFEGMMSRGWSHFVAGYQYLWNDFVGWWARSWERMTFSAKSAWIVIKGLFDDSTAASREGALRTLVGETGVANKKIAKEQRRHEDEIWKKQKGRIEDANALEKGMLIEIGKENTKIHVKLKKEFEDRMKKAKAEEDAAREALRKAAAEAKKKRIEKERDQKKPEGLGVAPDLKSLLDKIGKGATTWEKTTEKFSQRGTFRTAAVFGMQGGVESIAAKNLKANERAAENIEKIKKNTKFKPRFV